KTKKIIIEVIQEIDDSIINNDIAVLSVSSIKQLTSFKIIFLDILEKINNDNIPLKQERNLGISKIIIDQWPFSLALGALIIKAENSYKNM
ncbi:hypothetical protein ACK1FJ_004531, partial [Salmonella enterica]